jgi:pimeloyl-ACP methyl ester carboxylesterase
MTTFALVHGAWHGAWCWERLLEPLAQRGHGALAIDLPAEDPNAGLDECADLVAAFLAPLEDDVIVVGHSLNGLILPLVAARRPVRAVVYLAAFVPVEGVSMDEQFAASDEPILIFGSSPERDEDGTSRWTDPETAASGVHAGLPDEDQLWAFQQLRAQTRTSQRQRHPAGLPPVRSAYIVCTRDACISPAWQRRVAREHLGVTPVELEAGHFPMLTEPEALADALDAVSSGR